MTAVFQRRPIGRITAVPDVALSPSSGAPGAAVSVTGEGFRPGESVKIAYQTELTSPSSVSLCTTTATTDGTISCSGDIPSGANAGAAGNHKIKAKGTTSQAVATTTFILS
jgi:hypothetical protein